MISRPLLASLIVILFLPFLTLSQTQRADASPTPNSTTETVTFKYLLEQQEKQHAQQLLVQKEIADRAMLVVSQQAQTVLVIVEIGAFLIVLASTVGGWWVKRQIGHFQKVNGQSKRVLCTIEEKLAEIESAHSRFNLRIEELTQLSSPLESQIQEISGELKKSQELIEDMRLETRVAGIAIRLRSPRFEDKWRAAHTASEIARGDRGAVAIPLLIECLDSDPSIVTEALYGLSFRAKDLIGDTDAMSLILGASNSPEKDVRIQALEMIGKLGLDDPALKQRLENCREEDVDDEVRKLAERILCENRAT